MGQAAASEGDGETEEGNAADAGEALPADPKLSALIGQACELAKGEPAEAAAALAALVAKQMGGPVALADMPSFGFELAIAELKVRCSSMLS